MKENIAKFHDCYGCGMCVAICPTSAIAMRQSDAGFFQPTVDESKCVECGQCERVCAFADKTQPISQVCEGYAAYSNFEDVRARCSSGGVAYEIARYLIDQEYKYCGVRYNDKECRAEHYLATMIAELDASIGSKYVQSYTCNAFTRFDKTSKYVVVGTPCQIHSLRKYIRLKKIESNFVLIDFFCHGVPSYLMWNKYLRTCQHQTGSLTPHSAWRSKLHGWHDSWLMQLKGPKGRVQSSMSQGDLFYKFFLRNRCLSPCCYDSCKYKMTASAADIRIGDLWGTKYAADEKGVSGVIALTQIGVELLQQLESSVLTPEPIEVVTESQMKSCPPRPSSFNYVSEQLSREDISLAEIDRKASRIEFWRDQLPGKMRYYVRRLPGKVKEVVQNVLGT